MPARIRTGSLRAPARTRAVLDDVLLDKAAAEDDLAKAAAAAPEALFVRRYSEVLNTERPMREVRPRSKKRRRVRGKSQRGVGGANTGDVVHTLDTSRPGKVARMPLA